jgi:type IV fimbrial biogenesis protein FimT
MRRPRQGHTLPELLITLAILALLVSLGLPSFAALRDEWALRTATGALLGGLAQARMAALTRGTEAALCPSRDGLKCTRGAAGAFVVSALQPASQRLHTARLARTIELRANRPEVTYYRWPRAASPVTLTLCALPERARSRLVIVSQTGRPRVESAGPC